MSASILVTASASRSVPLGWEGEVMITRPPTATTAWAMRSSSVATHTESRLRAVRQRSRTR